MKRTATPRLFRVLLGAKDLDESRRFYETLLSARGRLVAPGRYYFDCGSVLLGILDYSAGGGRGLSPPSEALYFATSDLDGVYERAGELDCLSSGLIHDDPTSPLGQIVVRPWGERSFYAEDPSGNPLCFVEERTMFTGSPRQVAALRRGAAVRPTIRPSRATRKTNSPTRRRSRS